MDPSALFANAEVLARRVEQLRKNIAAEEALAATGADACSCMCSCI